MSHRAELIGSDPLEAWLTCATQGCKPIKSFHPCACPASLLLSQPQARVRCIACLTTSKKKTTMNTEFDINRFAVSRPEPITTDPEDTLVTDARAGLSPAQMVNGRLATLLLRAPLPSAALPVSRRPAVIGSSER
jgi:hypothetical protein